MSGKQGTTSEEQNIGSSEQLSTDAPAALLSSPLEGPDNESPPPVLAGGRILGNDVHEMHSDRARQTQYLALSTLRFALCARRSFCSLAVTRLARSAVAHAKSTPRGIHML